MSMDTDTTTTRRSAIEQALRRMKDAERNREVCQIPQRFKQSTFANYDALTEKQAKAFGSVVRYAQAFDERHRRGANLVMVGKPGTGKTHLAAALANDLLDRGYKVLYHVTPELLTELKESLWSRSQAAAMQALTEPHLLILDEVGVRESTEADAALLFRMIDNRYQVQRPTVVVSNLDLNDLARVLGERVTDRLTEDCETVTFTWESHRRCPANQKRVRRPEPPTPTLFGRYLGDQQAEYLAKEVFVKIEALDLSLLPFVVQATKSLAQQESLWEVEASARMTELVKAALANGTTVDKHWFSDCCWSQSKGVSA